MAETRHRRTPKRLGEPLDSITAALRAAEPEPIAELVRRLTELGLSERAVAGCFGVRCVGHALTRPPPAAAPEAWPPAAILPRLFVARLPVPTNIARHRLGDALDTLQAFGLIEVDTDSIRATVALLPVGESLAVCGPPPDDSSFHLIGALPTRRVRAWLDVGTGNGIALLARRGLATRALGTDVDRQALGCARIGLQLSGAEQTSVRHADLLDAAQDQSRWPLVTFNAPIPTGAEGPTLLDRFWQEVRGAVAADGEVIVHSQQPVDDFPARLRLPGSTVAVRYTPPGASPAFGVTIWRPADAERSELIPARLTLERPHLAREQFGLDI